MSLPMFSTLENLILASSSPRRQQFLNNLGIEFTVITADVDETPAHGESPETFAIRMARDKAIAVASANQDSWVIGADTVVNLQDGLILGKPSDKDEAIKMLKLLNNNTHQVMTGMCLCCLSKDIEITLVEKTDVTFANVSNEALRAYVQTGEPLDKAGSYGIQGLGSFLVSSIKGSCTNVIGLPVNRLIALLLQHKIITAMPLNP